MGQRENLLRWIPLGIEGFGIISQFDLRVTTVPGILQTFTAPVDLLCLEIKRTKWGYYGSGLADEGRKESC